MFELNIIFKEDLKTSIDSGVSNTFLKIHVLVLPLKKLAGAF